MKARIYKDKIAKRDERIVKFWRIRKNNSIPAMAKHFGLSEILINRIINNHIAKISKK